MIDAQDFLLRGDLNDNGVLRMAKDANERLCILDDLDFRLAAVIVLKLLLLVVVVVLMVELFRLFLLLLKRVSDVLGSRFGGIANENIK